MDTAARPPLHPSSSSPTHTGLLRSLAKLVRLHRRSGSRGSSPVADPHSNTTSDHDTDDVDSRTTTTTRSFFSFKPSRLKQSGPLNLDGAASAYARSEALHEDDVKRQNRGRETCDTVLAMVFAGVSAIKAAYAQLQLAQAPYDPEAVQAADVAVVAELKRISQIKHWYFSTKQHYQGGAAAGTNGEDANNNMYYQQVQMQMLSPDAHVAAEILEMRSLIKTYQITTKKLENELKRKDEEVARLGEELKEAEAQKRDLEQKLRALLDSARKNVPAAGVRSGNVAWNAATTNGDSHADCHPHRQQPQNHHRRNHHRSFSSSFSAFPGVTTRDDQATAAVDLGSGNIVVDLGRLTPSLFMETLRRVVKSARAFTRELAREMHSAGWDVYAAAAAIVPEVVSLAGAGDHDHLHLVLQSYICRRMFSAFQYPQFKPGREKSKTCDIRRRRERFLEEYMEMEQRSSNSDAFEEFLRDKYRAVVHPRMEAAFFGGGAGDVVEDKQGLRLSFPAHNKSQQHHPFFRCFHDLARRVWMLQRLFHAFEPEAGAAVFEVPKGSRFSEVYMQSASSSPTQVHPGDAAVVGFTVVPGFKLRGTVVPCRVYLVADAEGDGTTATSTGW